MKQLVFQTALLRLLTFGTAIGDDLRGCLRHKGNASGDCFTGLSSSDITDADNNCKTTPDYNLSSVKAICQKAAEENKSYTGSNVDDAVNECCGGARLPVISCEEMRKGPSINCIGYDTPPLLSEKERMFCEICETTQDITKARLFTYYICPAKEISPGPPPVYDPDAVGYKCVTKMGGTKEEKAKSGVFYQTFRVLEH